MNCVWFSSRRSQQLITCARLCFSTCFTKFVCWYIFLKQSSILHALGQHFCTEILIKNVQMSLRLPCILIKWNGLHKNHNIYVAISLWIYIWVHYYYFFLNIPPRIWVMLFQCYLNLRYRQRIEWKNAWLMKRQKYE